MRNLGPHITRITTPDVERWVRVAPIVKALDDPYPLTIARPDAWRVFRVVFKSQPLEADPGQVAGVILDRLKGYRHPLLYAEVYVGIDEGDAEQHAAFLARVRGLLRVEGVGVAGPSWYDGHGNHDQAMLFAGSVDAWASQGYWGDKLFTPWHALRPILDLPDDGRPRFVTECGRDQLPDEGTHQPGWLNQGVSAEQYIAECDLYDAQLVKANVFATLYTAGPYPGDLLRQDAFEIASIAGRLADLTEPPIPDVPRETPTVPRETIPVPRGTSTVPLLGPDVSSWQGGEIDMEAVLGAGRSFVWVKASEDGGYVHDNFGPWFAAAKKAGLERGAYHFARPNLASPAESVTAFQAVVGDRLQPGDLVSLDLEAGEGDQSRWAAEWLDLAGRVFNCTPVLYSGDWFMAPHGLDIAGLGRWPLWYAQYQSRRPDPPPGFERIAFWQFTARSVVPGIGGLVDESVFYGTREELRALGVKG